MKRIIAVVTVLILGNYTFAQISLEDCQKLVSTNYPLVKQHNLIEQTAAYSLSNVAQSYLPQISFSAQATYQSDVTAFPEQMRNIYRQMGLNLNGLNKDQYRATLEVSQIIWDGGTTKAKKQYEKAENEILQQNLNVELYALNEKINSLYFGILLLEEKLKQNNIMIELLQSNYKKAKVLKENGLAMQSDIETIEVEILSATQTRTQIESDISAYRRILGLFIGKNIENEKLIKPESEEIISDKNNRPELSLIDAQLTKANAQKNLINASLLPQIRIFAQGFYGNPGLNMFNDMIENEWTWNYYAGVKIQWNISSFYSKKNNMNKNSLYQQQIENNRDVFVFNTELKSTEQKENIKKKNSIMADDQKIIDLRTSIRTASETKLENGIIDINNLLQDISAENQALIMKATHEIEYLKSIYDFKNTINNN